MVNAWLGCFAQAAPWVLGSGLKGAWSCSQIESQSRQGANSGGWDCLHVAEGVGDGSRESWGPEPSAFVVVSIKARRSTAGDLLSPGTHCIWASYFSRTASCRPLGAHHRPFYSLFVLLCGYSESQIGVERQEFPIIYPGNLDNRWVCLTQQTPNGKLSSLANFRHFLKLETMFFALFLLVEGN